MSLDKDQILKDPKRKQLPILTFPDQRLRRKCEVVKEITAELQEFAKDMLFTMYQSNGIGLAAAQVDRTIRLLVADTRPRSTEGRYEPNELTELEQKVEQPFVIFNPVIKKTVGKSTYDEGCLSVPGYYETVERPKTVRVEGMDINGKKIDIEIDGLLGTCIQHEIDHLDGKLFIDRLSPIKSSRIKTKIKKFGYPDKDKKDEETDDEKDEVRL